MHDAARRRQDERWRHTIVTVSLLAIGCAGSTNGPADPSPSAPPPANPGPPTASCAGGDVASCLADRAPACVDERTWRLRFSDFPTLTVADTGAVRAEHLGAALLGTTGLEWLACSPDCAARPLCFPLRAPVAIRIGYDATCSGSDEASVWREQPARTLRIDCGSAGVHTIEYVPALAPVRDALLRAGIIAAGSPLARLDGLPVRVTTPAGVLLEVEAIEPGSCAALVPPADHQVLAGDAAFARLQELYPRHMAQANVSYKRRVDELLAEREPHLRTQVETEIGLRCRDLGDYQTLDDCLRAQPDLRALADQRGAEAMATLDAELRALREQTLAREYVAPLCQAFAPAP